MSLREEMKTFIYIEPIQKMPRKANPDGVGEYSVGGGARWEADLDEPPGAAERRGRRR